ncbi:MAG TPA: quinolinate synthase NadA [Mycobacteriales bacterium]|jgi:quinolinate synthase|nr:quinolinate synthase NadA [Mycobacteriales bacterium]
MTTTPEAVAATTLAPGWQEEVRALAEQRNAVLLAHNYQVPEIQQVADHVGDSLALSRIAAGTDAAEIVFCGVHFMAETAKLLSPSKRVLIPTAEAGCSLADTIDANGLRQWKAEHPGAAVVAYVNTSAAVKAEADICCTSSNAADVVNSIPAETPVLFCPDQFLGAHVQRVTGRTNLQIWMGECHVHAGISPADVREQVASNPDAELLIHPECGCATSALWLTSTGDLPADRTHILSTGGMADIAPTLKSGVALVATEVGMLHQLRRLNADVDFVPMNPQASCKFMKMITPELLLRCLRDGRDEIDVPADVASAARRSVERMVAIGNPGGGE